MKPSGSHIDSLTLVRGGGLFFDFGVSGLCLGLGLGLHFGPCLQFGLGLRFFGRCFDGFALRLTLHRWRRWAVGN